MNNNAPLGADYELNCPWMNYYICPDCGTVLSNPYYCRKCRCSWDEDECCVDEYDFEYH
jgi:hypothetical protein